MDPAMAEYPRMVVMEIAAPTNREGLASGRSTASKDHPSYKYYTSIQIEKGDTLWSIADTYMTSEYDSIQDYIREIKELNHLGPDDIHAGQYLTIPYYSGEFLE